MRQQSDVPGLSDEDRRYLAQLGRRSVLATGMVVCNEGDPTGSVFLIESGSVRIVRTAFDGREVILATRHPGELIGDLSAFDGQPRSAAAIANESTALVTIERDRFRHAVATRPPLADLFLRRLAHSLRAADELVLGRDSDDARTRIVKRLVNLTDGRTEPGAAVVDLRVRQADLAAWVGVSRETVARVMSELRAEQLVTTGRGTIQILDLSRLRSGIS